MLSNATAQNRPSGAVTINPAPRIATLDANEAVASVAYRMNEIFAIYPITPSSPMAEHCDEWSAAKKLNLWGRVPEVVQMQSEAGVAGAVHGCLQGGALTTTFTASQGLLLMIPNMYKIAGELTPFCMHVTARTLATHALSIFGDHSDVMACRQTGFAMLASNSVQEAQDMACIAQAATLVSRVPFLHFFDGFRTSHEIAKIALLDDTVLQAMLDPESLAAFRERGLSPDRPVIRGTAQNPDVFFQAREAINRFYDATPAIVQASMDRFAELTGRQYHLFDYEGDPAAERVIIAMGSGAETIATTAQWLTNYGEKVGVLKVRLYRPFSIAALAAALPPSAYAVSVLDRTKEPGAIGDPLYLDVVAALDEARAAGLIAADRHIHVSGGRNGLGSKEFTPAMVKGIYADLLEAAPKRHYSIGINDDITRQSLTYDADDDIEPKDVTKAVFFGLGSDGTVGANKNTIKIIGEETDGYAQGYFVYDSKKSGAMTISHLRFGPRPIRAPYLIRQADFVACHQFNFLDSYDILSYAAPEATLLLNAPGSAAAVWEKLPREVQEQILAKRLRVYAIDAYQVARESGMGGRINTVMQTCFFALAKVIPADEAIAKIKAAIEKTYGKKGEELVRKNFEAVDRSLAGLHPVPIPATVSATRSRPPIVPDDAPDFVRRITAMMMGGQGDLLPVSAFPVDGTWPTATARYEKRNLAPEIPVWDPAVCIQCNKCVLVCPHAAIRAKYFPDAALDAAPETFKSTEFRSREFPGNRYTLQVAPEDCTGCTLCVTVCPAKNRADPRSKAINMRPQTPLVEAERRNYAFFLDLPNPDRAPLKNDVKSSQFLQPLFEYSGACSGCGETPYLKLLTQLFGDRAVIANATGCSSIYGGNLPTTPYAQNPDGRGPAWANSLFEDNAEFGLGIRLALDHREAEARRLLQSLGPEVGGDLVQEILAATTGDETAVAGQRARVAALKEKLRSLANPAAQALTGLADDLVKKSLWIVGGDGWAYDIGYGGLDHVLSSGRNVNILVLDTEVYSNTGGQRSKATPLAATAKFSIAGKDVAKKDLGLLAMTYGNVYVARVAMGARDAQTLNAFREAEAYPGVSLIIAYSHCIAHGYSLFHGLEQQKLAVDSGYWPLFRYDPRRADVAQNPLQLDSAAPKTALSAYTQNELRYCVLEKIDPARARDLAARAQAHVRTHFAFYEKLAARETDGNPNGAVPAPTPKSETN